MKTEFFIAKRMLKGDFEKRISKPIVSLAIIGISLGIAVMILSVSVAVGFQTEVRDKVLGFGGHVQLTKVFSNDAQETSRMEKEQPWISDLLADELVVSIQKIAYKPGIIQSKMSSTTNSEGEDVRDMSGMIFKGIGSDYGDEFLQKNLQEGKLPIFETKGKSNDSIIISRYTASQLQVKLGDPVICFFVSDDGPKQKNLIVGGIYETGLEDFDKKFTYIDIAQISEINNWGVKTYLSIEENCFNGLIIVKADAYGGNGNYRYQWSGGSYTEANRIPICIEKDTVEIQVIVTDVEVKSYLDEPTAATIPDTAWLTIYASEFQGCDCTTSDENLNANYLSEDSTIYKIGDKEFLTVLKTSGGSNDFYCGGFEVIMKDFESLDEGKQIVQFYTENMLHVQSIKDRNEDIFNWLGMLDMNVYIIISLMILVAIINMTSALLVIILERTSMIGILKALGAKNWSIRKIFLINGGFIVLKGLFYGNILAIGIIILQNSTGFLTLSQSNYYVSTVPMHFVWWQIIAINLGAYVLCNLSLVLPSLIITKLNPVTAIKFE